MAQELIPNFTPGPLDEYRKQASFDWKQLKLLLETEDAIKFQNRLLDVIRNHPALVEDNLSMSTLNETRRATTQNMLTLKQILDENIANEISKDVNKALAYSYIMYCLNSDAMVKYGLTFLLFSNAIKSLGTERHKYYLEQSQNGDIFGCFCLTEIGHGSNTKGMRTTATYDRNTRQFILNSPDFEAAKCWAGSLGSTATHAVIFAQLITPDGTNRGLHAFVVEIRDPKTLLPHIGTKIYDMGVKMGLNGIDNGVIIFDNYPIPREALLNKTADVLEDGSYVSLFKNKSKRHGATFVNLSDGRIGISVVNNSYLIKAITIAIRYAAVRKQFSTKDNGIGEVSIIEYQSHQYRLFPFLAAAYALKIFSRFIFSMNTHFSMPNAPNKNELMETVMEVHAISSACKPLYGWIARDGIQECREACGGHGYLKAAGFGDIRNTQHASCTYEGENHVLIQQTSNWLLKFWPKIMKNEQIRSPLGTINFLSNAKQILNEKFSVNSVEELINPKRILDLYQWLVCYLLKSTHEKINNKLKTGAAKGMIEAKNESQVFHAKNLAIAYIECLILQVMNDTITKVQDPQIRTVLLKLHVLFGVWSLMKHIPTIYIGGYATGPIAADLIQKTVLILCKELKTEAVSLVDALAPPDFVLNSILGCSDGQVYKHLEATILSMPKALARVSWWKEIVYWKDYHSKL